MSSQQQKSCNFFCIFLFLAKMRNWWNDHTLTHTHTHWWIVLIQYTSHTLITLISPSPHCIPSAVQLQHQCHHRHHHRLNSTTYLSSMTTLLCCHSIINMHQIMPTAVIIRCRVTRMRAAVRWLAGGGVMIAAI